MKYQRRASKIQALMGFKPMSIVNIFKLKHIRRESLTNSGFDGIQTHDKVFCSFRNKREPTKAIQDLVGFKPMTKYSAACKISNKKAL